MPSYYSLTNERKQRAPVADRRPDNPPDVVDRLVRDNYARVGWVINRWPHAPRRLYGLGYTYDDVYSEGLQGLWRAALRYDGSTQFSTYSSLVIHRRIISEAMKASTRYERMPVVRWVDAVGRDAPCRDADPVGDADDLRATVDTVRALLRRLPKRHREVIRCRYGIGRRVRTLAEIGERLGVTRERVRQMQGQALYWLNAAQTYGRTVPALT